MRAVSVLVPLVLQAGVLTVPVLVTMVCMAMPGMRRVIMRAVAVMLIRVDGLVHADLPQMECFCAALRAFNLVCCSA